MDVIAERNKQCREARQDAAEARRFETPPDEIDYQLAYEQRLPDYLNDLDHYEFIGEALGSDQVGARILREQITDLDARIYGRKPRGDLETDLIRAVSDLAERARELVREPICEDVDYDRKKGTRHEG